MMTADRGIRWSTALAVLGFSLGASVALEMVVSGAFCGPVVLLGPSLSLKDEPIVWLGGPLGTLPSATMLKMMGMATKQARLSDDRRAELLADFRKHDPRIMRQGLRAYLRYLDRYNSPAARLCDAGVPAWVVHAEKGDGGLTREERSTLKACPRTTLWLPSLAPTTSSRMRSLSGSPASSSMPSTRRLTKPIGRAADLRAQVERSGKRYLVAQTHLATASAGVGEPQECQRANGSRALCDTPLPRRR